jgi:tetratricopeptide (TPR) repeat protein
MRGWAVYYRSSSRENDQAARGLFERALEINASASDAMAGLAETLVDDIVAGWSTSPETDKLRAEALTRQALELDPNSAEAHSARGFLLRAQNRLAEALDAYGTAIALNHNHANAINQTAIILNYLGRPEEAIPLIEKSLRLDPLTPKLAARLWTLASSHLLLGHVDQAIDLLRRARASNPQLYYVHMYLAGALGLKGDVDEAKLELAESIRLRPEFNNLKRYAAGVPWTGDPRGMNLREKTLIAGLRNAGMPEE